MVGGISGIVISIGMNRKPMLMGMVGKPIGTWHDCQRKDIDRYDAKKPPHIMFLMNCNAKILKFLCIKKIYKKNS